MRFAEALDALGIPYFLGGSLASSMQGEPRATNDIDVVVDLLPEQVDALVAGLGPDFDVDAEALRDAATRRASWNVFHVPSAMRIDVFVKGTAAYDDVEFARRRRVELQPGRLLAVKSPEDTVLRKLLWFRSGGEVAQSQWRDVVEVLRTSGPSLDPGYLHDWAGRLGLRDLLDRAAREAAW